MGSRIDGGRVVAVPAAKQRTLLACLLLRAGELVTPFRASAVGTSVWGVTRRRWPVVDLLIAAEPVTL